MAVRSAGMSSLSSARDNERASTGTLECDCPVDGSRKNTIIRSATRVGFGRAATRGAGGDASRNKAAFSLCLCEWRARTLVHYESVREGQGGETGEDAGDLKPFRLYS